MGHVACAPIDTMQRPLATILTGLAALVAIAAPIVVTVKIANRLGLDLETDRTQAFAAEVLHRSDETSDQDMNGITKLAARHAIDPCSPDMIATMREIDLASTYIQAVGHVSGDTMDCSSISPPGTVLPLGPVEFTTAQGVQVRTNVEFPFAKGERFIVSARDGFATVIHKRTLIDVAAPTSDMLLGTVKPGTLETYSASGAIRPRWLSALGAGSQASFIDSGYVVSVLRSQNYPYAAVAAVPVAKFAGQTRALFEWLIPVGILSGLVFAWAVLHLGRLQLAMPGLIRHGLRQNEFFMTYQPIVRLETREWIGAEALIGWKQSSGEVVRPDLFIPLAEDAGLIGRITERVMALVGKDAAQLLRRHPDFHIGFNVAAADMHSMETVGRLRQLLEVSGARPGVLVVEATERGFMKADVAAEVMRQIHAAGCLVAIDDFGTGYSSLSQLGNLELDFLKIDKSFVDTLGTGAATSQVAEHIIQMAKTLHLQIIAEGVETEEQAAILRERGVEFGQGWLFSKPMTFADLSRRLDEAPREDTSIARRGRDHAQSTRYQ